MPSRTTLLATTAALVALSAPLAFAAPPAAPGAVPAKAAAVAAAPWNADQAAASYAISPARVTSSGSENPDVGPGKAFDGNAATRWGSEFADNAWIQVDLGSSLRVNQVKLEWEAAYGKQYVLEISKDGTNWTNFYTETDGTGGTVTAHTYPQEVTGRYVRLRGVQRATAWGYSLFSFQVYGGDVAPASTTRTNLALNHPAYGNLYQHAGNSPAYVTDGGW